MRLGNSNGNNRGKKYFIRGRDDVNPKKLYTEEANAFADWFGANYDRLKRDVRGANEADEDTFSETYLRIYELIMYTGREIRDYKAFFHRAYYTNFVQRATQEQRYCNFFEHVEVESSSGQMAHHGVPTKAQLEEDDQQCVNEMERNITQLEGDIMEYVYGKYDLRDFEIFKMYMNLKPAINYHALSKMTGLKYHRIQTMISKIVVDVKSHEDFATRRKRLVGVGARCFNR